MDKITSATKLTYKQNNIRIYYNSVHFSSGSGLMMQYRLKAENDTIWKIKSGLDEFIEFNNANLSKVCTMLENKYNVQLENSNAQNLQFTGKFKQNASIDEICNVINTALKINLTRKSAK
jgi:hypothetical protein